MNFGSAWADSDPGNAYILNHSWDLEKQPLEMNFQLNELKTGKCADICSDADFALVPKVTIELQNPKTLESQPLVMRDLDDSETLQLGTHPVGKTLQEEDLKKMSHHGEWKFNNEKMKKLVARDGLLKAHLDKGYRILEVRVSFELVNDGLLTVDEVLGRNLNPVRFFPEPLLKEEFRPKDALDGKFAIVGKQESGLQASYHFGSSEKKDYTRQDVSAIIAKLSPKDDLGLVGVNGPRINDLKHSYTKILEQGVTIPSKEESAPASVGNADVRYSPQPLPDFR